MIPLARRLLFSSVCLAITGSALFAQTPATPPPAVASPEVTPEHQVTFRIYAPKAEAVRVNGGDMPALGKGAGTMTRGEDGVWTATVGPVEPGAYRYNFNVDGLTVIDPRNPATSESNTNTWSLVNVPGSEVMDTRKVPHGAVAEVTYWSQTLKRFRRMHVYTPPGYEDGKGQFPVFYLLHGSGDSDAAWSTVGRANFILDNLIADGKAVPMIVVMPAGHTGPNLRGGGEGLKNAITTFAQEFNTDIVPHIEKSYRVQADAAHRAIAGLSMGGGQTLHIAVPRLQDFGYIGVFSAGIFGIVPGPTSPTADNSWEEQNKAVLDNVELRKNLKLFWFGIGKQDFLLKTSEATVEMLKKHGLEVTSEESEGGHTWLNWRAYLISFAPKLFK